MARSIPDVNSYPLSYANPLVHSFVCVHSTAEEVKSSILSFYSNGCDFKCVTNFIYKLLADEISPAINNFINAFLKMVCSHAF